MNKNIILIMGLLLVVFSGCSNTDLLILENNNIDDLNSTNYTTYSSLKINSLLGNVSGGSTNLSAYYNKTETNSLFYLKTNPNNYINLSNLTAYSTTAQANALYIPISYNSSLGKVGTCGSGQVVQNVTSTGVQCVTDATGGGGGAPATPTDYGVSSIIKVQTTDLLTTDSLGWTPTQMGFNVYAGKSYLLLCDIMFTTAAATTGQVINLSTTAGVNNVYVMYDTWSSATAPVGLSATTFGTALIGTGSGATIIRPNLIMSSFAVTSNGTLNLSIRSEVNLSSSNFLRGSQCELFDRTNQSATVNIGSSTPGIIIQTTDVSTTSNTVFSATNMTFNVTSGNTYTLLCDIMFTTAAATTGQVINLSTTAGVNNVYIMYDTWSSATANVGFSTTTFGTILTGTGSGATIIKPNLILANFGVTSSGTISLGIRSEVSGSATNFLRGSKCELTGMVS